MLVLTRRRNQKILVGNIEITLVRIEGDKVRIGIVAPPEVSIVRAELLDRPAIIRHAACSPTMPVQCDDVNSGD